VTENAVEVRGTIEWGAPNTRAGRRTVPIPATVVAALEGHLLEHGIDDPRALMFGGPDGGPLRAGLFRSRFWNPAIRAAGLPGVRIHDLRHTAVSLWIAAGASPKQIATWAGHTSVSVVLDRYGHLYEGHEAEVLDHLDLFASDALVPGDDASCRGFSLGFGGFRGFLAGRGPDRKTRSCPFRLLTRTFVVDSGTAFKPSRNPGAPYGTRGRVPR
jgi:hypothetical protein